MFLGSVSVEVYRRIEEHVRKTAASGTVQASGGTEKASGEGVKEQNMNFTTAAAVASAAAPSPAPANSAAVAPAGKSDPARAVALAPATSAAEAPLVPWRNLRIGSPVLAKFWETNGEPNGWWVALITDVSADGFVARWLDDPLKPGFRIDAKHVALLHPSFDPTREWERKR